MSIRDRIASLEGALGFTDEGPLRLVVRVIFENAGVVDEEGHRTGAGPCDFHTATCGEKHFTRGPHETLDAFEDRCADSVPKTGVRVIWFWPDEEHETRQQ